MTQIAEGVSGGLTAAVADDLLTLTAVVRIGDSLTDEVADVVVVASAAVAFVVFNDGSRRYNIISSDDGDSLDWAEVRPENGAVVNDVNDVDGCWLEDTVLVHWDTTDGDIWNNEQNYI